MITELVKSPQQGR